MKVESRAGAARAACDEGEVDLKEERWVRSAETSSWEGRC